MALAAAVALITGIRIGRQRSAAGASYLALTMFAAALWAASLALESAAVDIPSKTLWSKVEYLGITSATALLLMFALAYTQGTQWLRFPRLVLLCIPPVLIDALVWTNEWHGLVWSSLTMSSDGNVLVYGHGVAFYLALATYTLVLMLTTAIFIWAAAFVAPLYRRRVAIVAMSWLPPWVLGVVYAFVPSMVGGRDVTALGFVLTCLLLNWSLLRYRMFDLVPVARDAVVDRMSDGVLVLDNQNRIADLNPAAQRLLGLAGESLIGQVATLALATHTGLVEFLEGAAVGSAEILLDTDESRHLDLRITDLLDPQGRSGGRLVVLRDITETVGLREKFRELSLTDELTGVRNRRGFLALADQELRLAGQLGTGICLLLADLDGLKQINDGFGHWQGDHALREVARILKQCCREADVVGRLGGDEFAVLAVGVSRDGVETLVGRVASGFESLNSTSGLPYSITVSVGWALLQSGSSAGMEELFRTADEDMYERKQGKPHDDHRA